MPGRNKNVDVASRGMDWKRTVLANTCFNTRWSIDMCGGHEMHSVNGKGSLIYKWKVEKMH